MTKWVFLFFVTFTIFYFLDNVTAEDDAENEQTDDEDRSRAHAQSSVSIKPGYKPGYNPPNQPVRGWVQCYSCLDCPKVYQNTTYKWCPWTPDSSKRFSCVTYAEKYKSLKKEWYIRGCASERGSCADIRLAHSSHTDVVKLVSCSQCDGDRCNGALRSFSDLTVAVFALLVTPLLAKLTLS